MIPAAYAAPNGAIFSQTTGKTGAVAIPRSPSEATYAGPSSTRPSPEASWPRYEDFQAAPGV